MTSKNLTPEFRHDAACGGVTDLSKASEADGAHGNDSAVGPPAEPELSEVLSDNAIGDWSDQFSAVTTRLRLMVDAGCAATAEQDLDAAKNRWRADTMLYVEALDQLHVTMMHDLDRRRQRDREVDHGGAWPDHPANAPSRSVFLDRLVSTLAEPGAAHRALLCVDLDDFNAINRDHGQDVGNELLRVVAVRLAGSVRAEDMVSHLDGDEFACLLRDLPRREQLSDLACKLFLALSTPLDLGHLRLSVRPSLGIARWPDDGGTAEALLRNADAARERAKRQATGYAFFNECTDLRA